MSNVIRIPVFNPRKRLPNPSPEDEAAALRQIITYLSRSSLAEVGLAPAMMAHELAQPVSAAITYLAAAEALLAKRGSGPETDAIEAVRSALLCLNRTGEMIRRIKDASCQGVFDPGALDLRSVVDDVLHMFGGQWGVEPAIDLAPDASMVVGDRIQIGQLLANLMRNAAEASDGQRVRWLRVRSRRLDEDMVEIRIEDNGPGLSAEVVSGLFAPSSSDKSDGLGLGLVICRMIVEQHRGRIWAEASPRGAIFCVALPAG